MPVSKSDFQGWLAHPVTVEAKEAIIKVAEDIAAQILKKRTADEGDIYLKGFLAGVQEMLDYEPEIIEED